MRFYTILLAFVGLLAFACNLAAADARVSIIIDDMGYRATDKLAFDLPRHVTFAILPHTLQSEQFARLAHQQGRTVMLHLPMETLQPKRLGPGALLANMNADSIAYTLDEALKTVPQATGVNNHMGSKLTQLTFPMTTLMEALAQRQLFFIDSRTTKFTKAHQIAQQSGVPVLQRKVFLDHEVSETFITEQFKRLVRLSKKYGQAIGIAHPHPLSISTLQKLVSEEQGVNFVNVADLLPQQSSKHNTDTMHQAKISTDIETSIQITDVTPAN